MPTKKVYIQKSTVPRPHPPAGIKKAPLFIEESTPPGVGTRGVIMYIYLLVAKGSIKLRLP